jgi:hypothetical protein
MSQLEAGLLEMVHQAGIGGVEHDTAPKVRPLLLRKTRAVLIGVYREDNNASPIGPATIPDADVFACRVLHPLDLLMSADTQ